MPQQLVSRSSDLVQRGPGVWQASALLPLPGRVRMPVNATILRQADGGLTVVSPIAFDDAMARRIDELGPVRTLVAPGALHHLFVADAVRRWPSARVWAAPTLRAKRPDLAIHGTLNEGAPKVWAGAIEAVHVGGAPKLDEVVLFHRASGTLVCADLVFHVTQPATLPTRLLLSIVGAGGGRLAQSRVWRVATRDRGAARAAAERILAWPIDRIAVAHGEPYDAPDARAVLARALVRMAGAPLPHGAALAPG